MYLFISTWIGSDLFGNSTFTKVNDTFDLINPAELNLLTFEIIIDTIFLSKIKFLILDCDFEFIETLCLLLFDSNTSLTIQSCENKYHKLKLYVLVGVSLTEQTLKDF